MMRQRPVLIIAFLLIAAATMPAVGKDKAASNKKIDRKGLEFFEKTQT